MFSESFWIIFVWHPTHQRPPDCWSLVELSENWSGVFCATVQNREMVNTFSANESWVELLKVYWQNLKAFNPIISFLLPRPYRQNQSWRKVANNSPSRRLSRYHLVWYQSKWIRLHFLVLGSKLFLGYLMWLLHDLNGARLSPPVFLSPAKSEERLLR